jgi:hypothetical protein
MGVKKSVKITKEQYNRIFASKLLKENFSMEQPMGQDIKSEVLELISALYGKSELSPFWEGKGISYDELCGYLLNKGLIIPKNGIYEIPKSLGEPQNAINQIEGSLIELIAKKAPSTPEAEPTIEPNIEPELSMVPEIEEENIVEVNGPLTTVASNEELSIVTDGTNLYTFTYADMSMEPLSDDELNNFVSMNPKQVGYGIDAWLDGRHRLIQIDDNLKRELEVMYDHDPSILGALSPVAEEEVAIVAPIEAPMIPEPTGNKIIEKLKQLKYEEEALEMSEPQELEEMTSAGSSATGGSSGPFTAPLNFGNGEEEDVIRMKTPIVAEMTDSSSSGPYDANALGDIGRDGSFKKHKKTPAETKTQWADGGFVEFNDCTKLNNKTSSTGCSGGAVDNVVSVKKTKGNVNAPSLQEMRILVTIAQKTGKSIQEIKTIIESKKPKA